MKRTAEVLKQLCVYPLSCSWKCMPGAKFLRKNRFPILRFLKNIFAFGAWMFLFFGAPVLESYEVFRKFNIF